MSKIGAAAILAMVALATAQDCVPELAQCHGSDASMQKACCDGVCVVKDEFYGQCLPKDADVPVDWEGTVMDYAAAPTAEDMDDDEEMAPTAEDMDDDEETEDVTDTEAPKPANEVAEDDTDVVDGAPAMAPEKTDAMVPASDGMSILLTYTAYTGKDYLPNVDIPKKVTVADVMPESVTGNVVMSQEECEDLCTATETCNAASYYLDGAKYGDMNCWLKTIASTCSLPADADIDANAVLLLKLDKTCPAVAPTGAGAVALAPKGTDAEAPVADTTTAGTTAGTGASTTSPTSAAVAEGASDVASMHAHKLITVALACAAVAFF